MGIEPWSNVSIGEVCDGIFDGPHATPAKIDSGAVFLGIWNIEGGRIDLSTTEHISDADWPRWTRRVEPTEGDLVFSYETKLGCGALIPAGLRCCLGRRMALARPNRRKVDPRFLLYTFLAPDFQETIRNYTISGSTVDRIPLLEFPKFPISLPPLPEQRAIARVLGGLDDKIELNRRMNRTLEDLARGLFRSWFVDFDPVVRPPRSGNGGSRSGDGGSLGGEGGSRGIGGHAGGRIPGTRPRGSAAPGGAPTPPPAPWPARLADSPLGPIPEGWRVGTVGEHMVNFDSKRVPVSGGERAKRQGKFPYYGAASVMDYVDDYLFDGIYLLVGEDGSVVQPNGLAVTQYVWGKIWVNNHAHVLQGKGAVSTEHLWAYFQHEDVGGIVTGAVQPKITQGNMNGLPFLYPGEVVCREFAQIVAPWFARVRANTEESRELAALRDALLPQLLSGEIRLRDAERAVDDAARSSREQSPAARRAAAGAKGKA